MNLSVEVLAATVSAGVTVVSKIIPRVLWSGNFGGSVVVTMSFRTGRGSESGVTIPATPDMVLVLLSAPVHVLHRHPQVLAQVIDGGGVGHPAGQAWDVHEGAVHGIGAGSTATFPEPPLRPRR